MAFSKSFIGQSATTYHLKVESGDKEPISFTVDCDYIEKDGKKIKKKEKLTTPYQATMDIKRFYGVFEKVSGTGSMDITVKSEKGELISKYNKSVVELYNGIMNTRKAD